ncbi:hypothetical protein REMIM1_PE00370 (plasmid) [Rhizobium etli bv. mimosae str. Mim1]|nr:hypothetical protein REMIM1_PE00370 [Rhizobium etli bv. mimosae str. Mim1]
MIRNRNSTHLLIGRNLPGVIKPRSSRPIAHVRDESLNAAPVSLTSRHFGL